MRRVRPFSEIAGIVAANASRLAEVVGKINQALELTIGLPVRVALCQPVDWKAFYELRAFVRHHLPAAMKDSGYAWRFVEEQQGKDGKYETSNVYEAVGATYSIHLYLDAPEPVLVKT